MILLLLSFLRTAALSRPASFFCEPPRSVGPLPYYRYILSTCTAYSCEGGHDIGVILPTGIGDRAVILGKRSGPLLLRGPLGPSPAAPHAVQRRHDRAARAAGA